MSRSGYCDDIDQWELIKWRGQVSSAMAGRRGQKLLVDLYKALDAMPVKELIKNELETPDGEVCALGALGKARGIDMKDIDPTDYDSVAGVFDVAHQLAQEVVFINDESCWDETPAGRYDRMKRWCLAHILPVPIDNPTTPTDGE